MSLSSLDRPSPKSAPASLPPLSARRARALYADEDGAATAEYAVATMATVGRMRHIRR